MKDQNLQIIGNCNNRAINVGQFQAMKESTENIGYPLRKGLLTILQRCRSIDFLRLNPTFSLFGNLIT